MAKRLIPIEDGDWAEPIKRGIAKLHGLTADALESPDRHGPVVLARRIAMFACSELTSRSDAQIGEHFGARHRTTVSHAVRRIRELVEIYPRIKDQVRVGIFAAILAREECRSVQWQVPIHHRGGRDRLAKNRRLKR